MATCAPVVHITTDEDDLGMMSGVNAVRETTSGVGNFAGHRVAG